MKLDTKTVGLALAHDSAALHARGAAIYIDDMLEPEGTLHVEPGYSPKGACGKIAGLNLDAVRALKGVVAVLTAKDIPGVNDCSPALGDDPIFAAGEIAFHGQVVFAVVAETRDIARRAARLAKIEIETVVPAVTVEDALGSGTRDVVPEYAFDNGDLQKAFKTSNQVISESFRVGGQEHFYIEGQVALAVPEEKGGMTVYSSTQHPTEVQHCIAKMLKAPDAMVTCECRRMGGGFGGKESQAAQWAALAALAAHVTGRPAKCRLDRDQDMMMTGKRHDARIDYRVGYDKSARAFATA
jgi:xanthine dehydrogenase large subunit